MSITLTWNGGQSAAMFTPSSRLMVAGLILFSFGLFFVGLLVLALLGGIGLVLWNGGTLLYDLVASVLSTDLLVQSMALLLVGVALCSVILFFLREIMKMLRKPVQAQS